MISTLARIACECVAEHEAVTARALRRHNDSCGWSADCESVRVALLRSTVCPVADDVIQPKFFLAVGLSGGINNRRRSLIHAVAAAKILNRTLLVPYDLEAPLPDSFGRCTAAIGSLNSYFDFTSISSYVNLVFDDRVVCSPSDYLLQIALDGVVTKSPLPTSIKTLRPLLRPLRAGRQQFISPAQLVTAATCAGTFVTVTPLFRALEDDSAALTIDKGRLISYAPSSAVARAAEAVKIHPSLLSRAHAVISSLGLHRRPFLSLHFRRNDAPAEWRASIHAVVSTVKIASEGFDNPIVYLSTDASASERAEIGNLLNVVSASRKLLRGDSDSDDCEDVVAMALTEAAICAKAHVFVGVSGSTMSQTIVEHRLMEGHSIDSNYFYA
jgi:hypothetical protein